MSLLASLRSLAATATGLLRTRLELLIVELEEEKSRIFTLLLYGAAAFFFLSFGLVMLAMFFTALYWETHRLLVIGIITAVFLGSGAVALWLARRQLRRNERMFTASLDELTRDLAALQAAARASQSNS